MNNSAAGIQTPLTFKVRGSGYLLHYTFKVRGSGYLLHYYSFFADWEPANYLKIVNCTALTAMYAFSHCDSTKELGKLNL